MWVSLRCRSIGVHGLNQALNVSALRLGPAKPSLGIPRIPLVLLAAQLVDGQSGVGVGPLHDAVDVALHCLFVESIEAHAVAGWWPGGARLGDLLDGVERMDKDAIWNETEKK